MISRCLIASSTCSETTNSLHTHVQMQSECKMSRQLICKLQRAGVSIDACTLEGSLKVKTNTRFCLKSLSVRKFPLKLTHSNACDPLSSDFTKLWYP